MPGCGCGGSTRVIPQGGQAARPAELPRHWAGRGAIRARGQRPAAEQPVTVTRSQR